MWDKRFAIIDIETTGGSYRFDKITEIAVLIIDKGEVVEKFQSLINPERSIPSEITRITGITNAMVENAPKFFELAKQIVQITEGCIFVAHNVLFDYSFIREEFRQLGFTYSRQRLCTVQLSRKYFPGLHSYSLGNLIKYFGISVEFRHRAMDDVLATTEIFQKILLHLQMNSHKEKKFISLFQENRFPPNIPMERIKSLSENCGVYFMLTDKGESIYIGKSKNIKERIFQHFNDTGRKTEKMLFLTYDIDYIETGSELMACLIESEEIKKQQPEINKAQRRKEDAFALYRTVHQKGYYQLSYCKREQIKNPDEALHYLPTQKHCHDYIQFLVNEHLLCAQVNSNHKQEQACSALSFGKCLGACMNKESVHEYNTRFQEMESKLQCVFKRDMLITDIGRTIEEKSVLLIQNGFCKRIGFISLETQLKSIEEIIENTRAYQGNVETNRIIQQFLKKQRWIETKYL